MDGEIKLKIITTSIDALVTHGLPAMSKLINSLNDRDVVTLEDIQKLKGELDAEEYFKSRQQVTEDDHI